MTNQTIECLALRYADGGFGVLPKADLAKAQDERVFVDTNEHDPRNLTDIVRVRIEVLEVVEKHRP